MCKMLRNIFYLFVIFIASITLLAESSEYENARLAFEEIAKKHGHIPQHYQVITDDGYILSLFRLPGSRSIPVLLQHGVLDASTTWIARGNSSLGITLANAKYDVWMANFRGNTLSRKHMLLNPDKDPAFWDYSLDNLGLNDIPAIIDKILSVTGAKKLNVIGHSLGNMVFYILGSGKPQYNDKINIMIALGPVCYLHDSDGEVTWLIRHSIDINDILQRWHVEEMFGRSTAHLRFLRYICSDPISNYEICLKSLLYRLTGYSDSTEINQEFYQIVSRHFPAGTSRKVFAHFGQIGRKKKLAKFDYGMENMKFYNSTEPAGYDLSKVTMKIALVASENDKLSIIKNVKRLKRQLGNVVDYVVHPRKRFSHLDFTWGRTTKKTLFPYIFHILN